MNSSHVSFHNRIFHYSDFPFLCVSLALGKGRVLYVGNNNKMISQLSVGSQSHLVARMFCGCGIKLLNSKREHSIFEVKFLFNWGWCHKILFWAQKCHPMGQHFIIGSTQILKNPFRESFYHSPFAPDIKQFAGWLKWQFSFYLALKPSSGSCTSYYQQCQFKSSLLHTFPLKICSIFIAVRPLYFGNERWLLELHAVV